MLTQIRIGTSWRRLAWLITILLQLLSVISTERIVEFKLLDNTGPDHLIGNIGEMAFSLNKKYLSVHITQTSDDYFRTDDSSNLFTTNNLDRDEVCVALSCCDSPTCTIQLDALLIENAANSQNVKVQILLNDENDNAPVFTKNHYEIEIVESTSINTEINLPVKAKDADSPKYGIDTYQINDKSKFWLINDNENNLKLRVVGELDREQQDSYELTIKAFDKGNPKQTGDTTLTIRISDANDNKPEFQAEQNNPQTVKIPENSEPGTFLKEFVAKDKDEIGNSNSDITYQIGSHSLPEGLAMKKFQIDSKTGRVTLKSAVDYEKVSEREFTLYIIASDNGLPKLSSVTSLKVLVQNVNDNQLQFKISSHKDVKENDSSNKLVAFITVSDDDDMKTSINCSLKNKADFELKAYSQRMYGLITKRTFDYEVQKEAIAVLRCKESDPASEAVEKAISIKILDKNDNIPQFEKQEYIIHVSENTPVNTAILKLNVTDRDSGKNGEIAFNFSAINDPSLSSFLSITQSGGVILMKRLDRESIQRLRFKIQATDGGLPRRFSETELILHVKDFNDNTPRYYGPHHFFIEENPVEGTELSTLDFRDADIDENGQIDLKLISETPVARNWFKIFQNKLFAYHLIDREKASNVTLTVEVKDRGRPPRTDRVTLYVSVLDVNDNKPKLMFPKNNTLIRPDAPIPRNFPKGSYITQLNVVDGDNGPNGTVSFKIRRSNASEGTFSIGPADGRLLTNWDENSQPDMGIYYVQIVIEDDGKPKKLHSTVIFYINVTTSMYQGIGSDPNLSNMIILILIVICSVALIISLIAAIFWVRFRINRPDSRLPSGYVPGGQFTKNYCDPGQSVHFYQPADMQPDYHVMDFNIGTATLPKKESLRLQTISRHDEYFPMDNLGHSTYCPSDGTISRQGQINPSKPLSQCNQCIPGQYPTETSVTLPPGFINNSNAPLLPAVSTLPISSATMSTGGSTLPATSSCMGNGPPPYYSLHLNGNHHHTLQPLHGRDQAQPSSSHLLQVNGNNRGASSGKTERRLSDQSYSDSGKGGSLEDLARFTSSTSTFANPNLFGQSSSGGGLGGASNGAGAGTTTATLGSKLERIRGMQAAAAAAAAIAAASQSGQSTSSTPTATINTTATMTNRNAINSLRSTNMNGGSTSTLTGVIEHPSTSSPSLSRAVGASTNNMDKNKQYYIDRANTPETMC